MRILSHQSIEFIVLNAKFFSPDLINNVIRQGMSKHTVLSEGIDFLDGIFTDSFLS